MSVILRMGQVLFKTELNNTKKIIKYHKKLMNAKKSFLKNVYLGLQMKWTNKAAAFISSTAIIGEGTMFLHGCHGIHIRTSNIGKNCLIYQQVQIISKKESANKTQIGDWVIMGANSMIIGDVKVGDNVTIGAGAIVTKDVPSNSVVVNNNEIISANNSNKEYIEELIKNTMNTVF
ncbi:hypothetical protein [Mycoplasma todarodis]|uniref:hypothetical protein n=1 Tax=Mycoplasma todarodis TaxID=1937191 RepID=UPI003B371A6A